MAQYIKELYWDIDKDLQQTITVQQGDSKSRYLRFHLLQNSLPLNLSNNTVKIYALKSDGTQIFNNVTVEDAVKGQILVELTSQTLAISGDLPCQLKMYGSDSSLLSTRQFSIAIKPSLNDSGVESTNEFTGLQTALGDTQKWNDEFASIYPNIETKYQANLNNLSSQLAYMANINKFNYNSSIVKNGYISRLIKKIIKQPVKIVGLGDSIMDCGNVTHGVTGGASAPSKGWFNLVTNYLQSKYTNVLCTNRGVGGQTVLQAFERIKTQITPYDYDLIFVELGTNDWNYGTPLEEFETNYRNLVQELVDTTRADILCVGLGWFNTWNGPASFTPEWKYNNIIEKIALEFGIGYIDTRSAMMNCGYTWNEITFAQDPVHPNDLGHQIWAGEVITWLDFQGCLVDNDFRNSLALAKNSQLLHSYLRCDIVNIIEDVNASYYWGKSFFISSNVNNNYTALFVFYGSDIKILYTKSSNYGKGSIYIDGQYNSDIDCYNATTTFSNIKEIKDLGLDWHFVSININDKNVSSSGYSFNFEGALVKNFKKEEELAFTDGALKSFAKIYYAEPFAYATCYQSGYGVVQSISNKDIQINTNPVGQGGYLKLSGY